MIEPRFQYSSPNISIYVAQIVLKRLYFFKESAKTINVCCDLPMQKTGGFAFAFTPYCPSPAIRNSKSPAANHQPADWLQLTRW